MSVALDPGPALVERLGLEPHPEGGFFRRIHTDAQTIRTTRGERARCSSIHYLLTHAQPLGRLHRNASDILHYLQDGGPVEYLLLDEAGALRRVVLGHGPDEALFLHVPGGTWKASRLVDGATHALVLEVVVPGFDYSDHAFADSALLAMHPEHAATLAPFIRAG